MASSQLCFLLSLLLTSIFFLNCQVKCDSKFPSIVSYQCEISIIKLSQKSRHPCRLHSVGKSGRSGGPAYSRCPDEDDNILQGINSYRSSLNLTTLQKVDNAECLANEIADQFKTQPCTNSTGSNTVLGTEPQFTDYPNLLSKCNLNISVTRDGIIMPACVPNLTPNLVLSNFTQSQYSLYLNDSKYVGAGIGSEDSWIVVILTTNTDNGGFVPANNKAGLVSKLNSIYHLLIFMVVSIFIILF